MTDQQIKDALTDWVKDYCNNLFLVLNPDYDSENPESQEYITVLPGGVLLFLEYAVPFMKSSKGVQSESLGDYSVTMSMDFPESMLKMLRPYRKVKFV